jgi:negative regulator of flagellin synthesis FlgM
MVAMQIGRIDSTRPVSLPQTVERNVRADSNVREGDSVNISSEAIEKAEFMRLYDIVSDTQIPDIREDRVAELRAKINDPAYITDTILNGTADGIMDFLGI